MEVNPHILPGILKDKLVNIQELCRKHRIKRLWAFGSVLTDEFREDSDIDLLHEWDEPNISDQEYLANYYSFVETLKRLLGRKIDFVHYPSLKNPYFIKAVDATKVLLYQLPPILELAGLIDEKEANILNSAVEESRKIDRDEW